MKHLRKGRKLKRTKDKRNALLKTMLGSFVMREKIQTTEAKAKELKGLIDQIINKAKSAKKTSKKVSVIRDLKQYLPIMAINKLSGSFIDKFSKRSSGYCRIIKIAARKSDAARMAIIEFVD